MNIVKPNQESNCTGALEPQAAGVPGFGRRGVTLIAGTIVGQAVIAIAAVGPAAGLIGREAVGGVLRVSEAMPWLLSSAEDLVLSVCPRKAVGVQED